METFQSIAYRTALDARENSSTPYDGVLAARLTQHAIRRFESHDDESIEVQLGHIYDEIMIEAQLGRQVMFLPIGVSESVVSVRTEEKCRELSEPLRNVGFTVEAQEFSYPALDLETRVVTTLLKISW